jgi:zinc transport system ATP-binding protein
VPLALELKGVSFSYAKGPPVLRDVDLRVSPGELIAIAGPNGGGKTTLVRLALGLLKPDRGEVELFGEPVQRFTRRARLAYLPQRAQLGTDSPVTVEEIVAAGRLGSAPLLGPLRRRDREIVADAIDWVGLTAASKRPVATLSGGQQQLTLIAKALAARPELLVMDEPTVGVDAEAQEALAGLLDRLHRELAVTVLYVSHEFGAIERFVERLVLVRGAIVFDGHPSALPEIWHDPSHVHV